MNHVSGIGDEVGSALLASLGLADDMVRVEHLAGTADSACPTHSGHDSRRAAWVFNPLGSGLDDQSSSSSCLGRGFGIGGGGNGGGIG